MNVFDLRSSILKDYQQFTRSFTRIRAEDISAAVDGEYAGSRFWPEPLLQLNPRYEPAAPMPDMVADGTLHPGCLKVFAMGPKTARVPLRLHAHQGTAAVLGAAGKSFVVTTGTGSGKSLCFFLPIVSTILAAKESNAAPRTRAIVIYPMNALANSQAEELKKYVDASGVDITFARYTGQESASDKQAVADNPPDIILTNFMMLELLMTRQDDLDRRVMDHCRDLQFLVLDELHTYRGRQGADVAMLVRRVRERLGGNALQCIGTSATMSNEGPASERNQIVAAVATRLFATPIDQSQVVTETLKRATDETCSIDSIRAALGPAVDTPLLADSSADDQTLRTAPIAIWTELTLGLRKEPGAGWERARPSTLDEAAKKLSEDASRPPEVCRKALEEFLLLAARTELERTGKIGASTAPFFAFKLHQWLSGAAFVYATLEAPGTRSISLDGQVFAPGKPESRLYSTHFCRDCGQEYHPVEIAKESGGTEVAIARRIDDTRDRLSGDEETDDTDGKRRIGFLAPVPSAADAEFRFTGELEDYPESWIEFTKGGAPKLKASRKKVMVERMSIDPSGRVGTGLGYWFMPGRFNFCLRCGVVHGAKGKDINTLAGLSAEGRSSATTMLTLGALRWMHGAQGEASLQPHQRKLLGFSDNRQDAALQAGHFNDFVLQGVLRGAMLAAVGAAGPTGLSSADLGSALQRALGVDGLATQPLDKRAEFLSDADLSPAALGEAEKALRDVLAYRGWIDQRRGWRFTNPTLEQLGLIESEFPGLAAAAADTASWSSAPALLREATPTVRASVLRLLLVSMLQGLAIGGDTLQRDRLEKVRDLSRQRLRLPWALGSEDDEPLRSGRTLLTRPVLAATKQRDEDLFLRSGPQTPVGKALKSSKTWAGNAAATKLKKDEYIELVEAMLEGLRRNGLVAKDPTTAFGVPGWRLLPGAVTWRLPSALPAKTNAFFVEFYRTIAAQLQSASHPLFGLEAREHTAQVRDVVRERREQRFRFEANDRDGLKSYDGRESGDGETFLPLLFCSPTMELGVDISALNVVHLRNVPPTPANYAQRSGRAGRSGMAALVITYCASQSPHDQYFFRDPRKMVHGQVRAPLLDLANRELIESHLHAVWLAATHTSLSGRIREVLDLGIPSRPPRAELLEAMTTEAVLGDAVTSGQGVMSMLKTEIDGTNAPWCADPDAFVRDTMGGAAQHFGEAFARWRSLFGSAEAQRDRAQAVLKDYSSTQDERREAQREQAIAEQLITAMLESGQSSQSDFYTYRYLATEGFLPGYNFPRLPLLACIPSSRDGKRQQSYVQRPRFLALSEFGPRALLYHEGRAYRVDRVRLGAQSGSGPTGKLETRSVRICTNCGAGDFTNTRNDCAACGRALASPETVKDMYRIEHVDTRAAERITADDEDRQRQGFELQSTFEWASRNGKPDLVVAAASDAAGDVVRFRYGASATITRLNKGLRRRKEQHIHGYWINPKSGYWSKDLENAPAPSDPGKPVEESVRIVPFVQEQKNALHLHIGDWLTAFPKTDHVKLVATLQHALKRGIEAVFQLEESELLIEALPRTSDRKALLFYEATEGGAGVLTRLVNEPDALARVARAALNVMHLDVSLDPAKPVPLESALQDVAGTDCVAGCYRCILSYYNQPDHLFIDRRLAPVRALLVRLTGAQVSVQAQEPVLPDESAPALDAWTAAVVEMLSVTDPAFPPHELFEQQGVTIVRWPDYYTFIASPSTPASLRDSLESAGYMGVPFPADQASWPQAMSRLRKNLS